MEQKDLISTDFGLDDVIIDYLKESGKWCKFLGITGFVFSGLFILVSIFGSNSEVFSAYSMYGLQYIILFVYVLLAIISFAFSLFLLRFGTNIKAALEGNHQDKLIVAFGNLRLFFRMSGIITVLYIVFILLAIIGGVISAASRY